jgi:hypothetical protein
MLERNTYFIPPTEELVGSSGRGLQSSVRFLIRLNFSFQKTSFEMKAKACQVYVQINEIPV